jgi:P-type Cu+ transporter
MERSPSTSSQKGSQSQPSGYIDATDPVCGMEVDPSDPDTERSSRGGKTYCFCSAECREQFEASPDDFGD